MKSGGTALAPTDPILGLAFMVIAAVIIFAGFIGYRRIYAIAILPVIALLAYSGIYTHVSALISNSALPGYFSALSWGLAIGINLIGLLALVKGARLTK
ncbi:hypothetical protein [Hellea balneolensis]|uniref:hypothetical protein n=1 Tax=Hellea balneolensis TaxID=287478 RepID=UPI0004107420|nr:hypothetical protein [Hellea balneolensis]